MKTMFEQLMNTYAQQHLANWSLPELMQFKNCLESKSGWRDKYPDILDIRISENELPFEVCVDDVLYSVGLNGFNCDNERRFCKTGSCCGKPRRSAEVYIPQGVCTTSYERTVTYQVPKPHQMFEL